MNIFLNWIFWEKRLLNNFLNWIFLKKIILNNPLNWILSWNEWITQFLNQYLPFFDDKPPFFSILDTFWPIFGHFSYSTSINHSLTIELNNILNWILGKAILNRILNESFFGKIQILNWIRLGIVNHYITSNATFQSVCWNPLQTELNYLWWVFSYSQDDIRWF